MIGTGRAKRPRPFFLALALSIIWSSPTQAKTTTIDDSGTQALEPMVIMHWKTAAPARSGDDNLLIGATTIRVRINVTPWLRRSGRIYLSLPAQQPGPLRASWVAQSRFLPGTVQSGNRMLIYAGPITTPFMEDVLNFQFSVNGSVVRRAFPVTFHFEMDES
jgi:hypothetical protein